MIPPSVPKGGELVTHTRSTCTLLHYFQGVSLQPPPARRFMAFIYTSEDTLIKSLYCWCLLSGWTCLSRSLARWKHCLLFQRVNQTNQFNQCSSHSRYYADWKNTQTQTFVQEADHRCPCVQHMYMYSTSLWLSTCIHAHKHTCEFVEPKICLRADLRDSSSKQATLSLTNVCSSILCLSWCLVSNKTSLFTWIWKDDVCMFWHLYASVITLTCLSCRVNMANCPFWCSSRLLFLAHFCSLVCRFLNIQGQVWCRVALQAALAQIQH